MNPQTIHKRNIKETNSDNYNFGQKEIPHNLT